MHSIIKSSTLACALILLVAAGCSGPANDSFPNRDIEIVIPYAAGGGFDTYVRALAPHMEKYLEGDFNILPINVPGAGGRRGASEVYRANPDGYTIGIFNLPGVLLPQLQGVKVNYDLADVSWLSTLSIDAYAVIVKGDSTINSIQDFKTLGRPVVYGATGPSSTSYIATTIVSEALEIPYEVITGYKGSSEYILGVIRGDVDATFANLSTVQSYIESGDVKMVALIGDESDDPAIYDASDLGIPELGNIKVVRMVGGPPGLPDEIKKTLEQAILSALADPEFKTWLEATGNDVYPAGASATAQSVGELSAFYDKFKEFVE
ncbi:MAG: Bug family tripartite tricarboxylate transporter substrate binding protein [Gammaproteobacteria bacterium]|jgi:tripartite-type tricarboxylate transporter receptor subunit TctC